MKNMIDEELKDMLENAIANRTELILIIYGI